VVVNDKLHARMTPAKFDKIVNALGADA